jgi:hypothetical protein
MRRLRTRDWLRLGAVVALISLVLVLEASSRRVSEFYVDHPLQAGILSGILLSVVALFGIDAVRADLHERRWGPLSRLALLSLAAQTTLLIDVALWLATGQRPVNDARPVDSTHAELERIRQRAGLPDPPAKSDLGAVEYEAYDHMLRTAARDSAWRDFANGQLDRWKWRNRDGIARWAAAMLTTGETSDVLNRLARLNEWLSDVQHTLRPDHHVDADSTAEQWLAWHAEAASLREDLVRAARDELPAEWTRFRRALPAADRDELECRAATATRKGARHVLVKPLHTLEESHADQGGPPRSAAHVTAAG